MLYVKIKFKSLEKRRSNELKIRVLQQRNVDTMHKECYNRFR